MRTGTSTLPASNSSLESCPPERPRAIRMRHAGSPSDACMVTPIFCGQASRFFACREETQSLPTRIGDSG